MKRAPSKWLLTLLMALVSVVTMSCSDESGKSDSTTDTSQDTGGVCAAEPCPSGFEWSSANCRCESASMTPDMTSTTDTSMPDIMEDTSTPDMTVDVSDVSDATDALDAPDIADVEPPPPPLDVTWPATPEDYAAQTVSYVKTLQLPIEVDGSAECCHDFGDISRNAGVDNALAELLLSPAITKFFDVNIALEQSVVSGGIAILFDHRELDGFDDPDNFILVPLQGDFEGTTNYASAAAGEGTFTIDTTSFLSLVGEPASVFNPAMMIDHDVEGGPTTYLFKLTLAGATLELPMRDARIKGRAETWLTNPTQFEYVETTPITTTYQSSISGYVELDDFRQAINSFFVSECGCLGLTQELYGPDAGNGTGWSDPQCMSLAEAEALCPNASGNETGCVALVDDLVCGILPLYLAAGQDINTDDDPQYEALSVGLTFTAVPAQVVGLSPPAP